MGMPAFYTFNAAQQTVFCYKTNSLLLQSGSMSHKKVYLALAFGIICISASSILVKHLGERGIAFLGIAFYRMYFAALLTAIPFLRTVAKDLQSFSRRNLLFLVAAGFFLALHFGTWTVSLAYIPVGRSVLLVTCHPIFTAIASRVFLGEAFSKRNLGASLVAFCGIVVILSESASEFSKGGQNLLWGDLLAMAGAITIVGYIILGRRLRAETGLATYTTTVYTVTSIFLLVPALMADVWPWTLNATDYFWLLALAVVPTIGGHTVFNYLLKDVSASLISVAFLGEPLGASLLAWAIWGQVPSLFTLMGGLLVITGIYLVRLEPASSRASRHLEN